MKKSTSLLTTLLASTLMSGGILSNTMMAQEKAETRILLENDKVRVLETWFKPGTEAANIERPFRIVRALTDGTIQRTYPDGKTEAMVWKAGEVRALDPDKFLPKNIGTGDFGLFIVELK